MSVKRGTDEAGYELRSEGNLLFLTCWGIFDLPIVQQQQVDLLEAFKSFGGQPWAMVADLRRHPIQPPPILAKIKETMAMSKAYNHKAGATVVSHTLTKMHIRRIAQETHTSEVSFFTDPTEATTWVKKLLAGEITL